MFGAARADGVRGPQTAMAVRVRVAAQRAVFGIVCILPLGSESRSGPVVRMREPGPVEVPVRRAGVCRVRTGNSHRPLMFR
ncbi:hypothetical protein GCM10022206_22270 [Streptomyces chiangmaiensis]